MLVRMRTSRTFNNCLRNAMKSAHSCTLSNVFKHLSTCCAYFLYLGSEAWVCCASAVIRMCVSCANQRKQQPHQPRARTEPTILVADFMPRVCLFTPSFRELLVTSCHLTHTITR